jgi:uncharacterized PurR-regulated membrane protein YhhQ (DUF165 family)
MMLVGFYVAAIVAANLSVAVFGPWVSPINAFLFIGFDFFARDRLHDQWNGKRLWIKMGALIAASGAISFVLNPASGIIALASVIAFVVAGFADAAAYHAMKDKPYMMRSNGSNVAGSAVDSLLFPAVAFGAFMPEIVALQFAAKVAGAFVWSLVISIRLQKAAE